MANKQYRPEMMFESDRPPITYWIPLFFNENTSVLYASIIGLSIGTVCRNPKRSCRAFRRAARKMFKRNPYTLLSKLMEAIWDLLYRNSMWFFIFGLGNGGYLTLFIMQNLKAIVITIKQIKRILELLFKTGHELANRDDKQKFRFNLKQIKNEIRFICNKLYRGWIPRLKIFTLWVALINCYQKVLPWIFKKQFGISKSSVGVPLSFYKNLEYNILIGGIYALSVIIGVVKPKIAKIAIRYLVKFGWIISFSSIRYMALYSFYTSSFFVALYNKYMLKNYYLITEGKVPGLGYRAIAKLKFWLGKVFFDITTINLEKTPGQHPLNKEETKGTFVDQRQKISQQNKTFLETDKKIELSAEISVPLSLSTGATNIREEFENQSNVHDQRVDHRMNNKTSLQ